MYKTQREKTTRSLFYEIRTGAKETLLNLVASPVLWRPSMGGRVDESSPKTVPEFPGTPG